MAYAETAEKTDAPVKYTFHSPTVLREFKNASQTFKAQRKREADAIKFFNGDQWDQAARDSRDGKVPGGNPVPARPYLTVNKLRQPVQLIQNQWQNAHLGINVHPLSAESNKETAEIIQGIIRKEDRDSNSDQARGWAFARAIQAGMGTYLIVPEYDEESDDPLDQKCVVKRLLYQDQVYWDPAAQMPDFSDANYAFLTSWVSTDTLKQLYPKAQIGGLDSEALASLADLNDEIPDWVKFDGNTAAVLVASYWCKKQQRKEVAPGRFKVITELMFYKCCAGKDGGLEVLEESPWNGQYIPLITVLGNELQPSDTKRRWVGIVEPAMDSQRTYNYTFTTAVEIAALEPKAPWVGAAGAFEGHEQKWESSNTRNWAYLEYNQIDVNGQPAPPPSRTPIDASRLNVSLTLMQQADVALQASTSTPDPSLGKAQKDESGRKVMALQDQAAASTSNYLYDMANISMTYEAKVRLDMIPRLYGDRQGRLIRILDGQDEDQEVILGAPFYMDADGRAKPVQQATPMSTSMQPFSMPQPQTKTYDLTKGKYGVTVSIGKSYQSRYEQGRDQLAELMGADPSLMGILGDLFFKYNDAPWAPEAAERMKKIVHNNNPALAKSDTNQPTPEQLQAENEALKAEKEEMGQMLQQMKQELDTKYAEQQGKIRVEEIKGENAIRQAEIKAQTEGMTTAQKSEAEREKAELQAMIAENLQAMKDEAERARQEDQQHFQLALEAMKQQFEAKQAALERQANERMAAHQAEVALEQAEQAEEGQEEASESESEGATDS